MLSSLTLAEWTMILLPPFLYWTYSTFFYILSRLELTTVELHRIPTDQKMRPQNRVTVQTVLCTVLFQHILQIGGGLALALLTRPDNLTERSIEPLPLLVLKLFLSTLIMDAYQYWGHRWMHHNRWMYRHFHSVHHQLTVPYAFGALYNHPLEGFFLDTLSGAIPALLLDLHPWTATMLFSLGTLKTVDDHCGYTLPWDIFQMIFPNNAAYHDIHHWGKGRMYNFSQPFYIYWDLWMGTDYDMAMKKKEEEKDSKEVPEERVAQKTMEEDKENIRPSQTVKKQWIMTLKPTHGLRHRHSVE